MPLPRAVRMVEVTPRDGLQNEAATVPTAPAPQPAPTARGADTKATDRKKGTTPAPGFSN